MILHTLYYASALLLEKMAYLPAVGRQLEEIFKFVSLAMGEITFRSWIFKILGTVRCVFNAIVEMVFTEQRNMKYLKLVSEMNRLIQSKAAVLPLPQ